MVQSVIHEAGSVQFPLFNHERHYMIPFKQSEGLPKPMSHWQQTVDDMLEGVKTDDTTIYFMADQSLVFRGETQRRPGVHVDGYWIPELRAHGGGSHGGSGGGHGGYGRHSWRGGHGGSHMRGDWSRVDFSFPEALILATSVEAACGYEGVYDESLIQEGGDASLVPLHGLKKVHLESHRAYIGNVGTLHESLPVNQDCLRTLVRLNVPGVSVN